jgi:AcrR family transcriptional regulator
MAGKKQFDPDTALEAAMIQFWRVGYADTSVDALSAATGLNRSSIYASLGDKESLYLRCLTRYGDRYGKKYDEALSGGAVDPLAAVRRFFGVTLDRIADPAVPDGCLVAQTALAIPALTPRIAAGAAEAVDGQRQRLWTALNTTTLTGARARSFAEHLTAVNQSLAVMSRAGADGRRLRSIVAVSIDALSQALRL